VPVDPYSIARSLGIDVLAAPLTDDVSGMLVKQAGRDPQIYVSSDDADVRQRFTCAHEIGHYLLRSSGDADDDFGYVDLRGPTASRSSEPHEIFANQFAAALLMPRANVSAWHEHTTDAAMAVRMQVSLGAMRFRLTNLGYAD
jgi:Zn-dependent peptidase ImmA (M78 family)